MLTLEALLVHSAVTLGVMSIVGMAFSGYALWRQRRKGGAR